MMIAMVGQKEWGTQSNNSMHSSAVSISPQEEALQSLCKQLLKSFFFRGYYKERRYVEALSGYRDIVGLHRSERDLERLLMEVKRKLQLFYGHVPNMWIGITHGVIAETNQLMFTLDTHIWVQLEELAFGQYWFTVKSIRFRPNEIILKLKMVRNAESDTIASPRFGVEKLQRSALMIKEHGQDGDVSTAIMSAPMEGQIGLEDFTNVIRDWATSIKHSVYDFMSNDINKDNVKDFFQFLGLLVVSLLTGLVVAIKYLGSFAIRFMFEFTRFTQAMTPIILKMIEVINKIVSGFYILIAMIWKDAMMKRRPPPAERMGAGAGAPPAIEYKRPLLKTFDCKTKSQSQSYPQRRFTEFERKYQ